jgi:hypothetical protein
MIRLFLALILTATPALAADKLAPPRKVESMLGDVAVMNAAEEEPCNVILYEDKVPGGYRIEQYEGCDTAYPVMAKVKAWRAYTSGEMSFADAKGKDLVRFKRKSEYIFRAVKPVDGIVKLWSAQEVNE